MQFELLDRIDDAKWDRMIAPWPGRLIFHQAAWLRFLIDSRPDLRLVRHKLVRGSSTKGFFVGFIEKKGPFLMMGSPLYGWFTDFMGPVSDHAWTSQLFCMPSKSGALRRTSRSFKSDTLLFQLTT